MRRRGTRRAGVLESSAPSAGDRGVGAGRRACDTAYLALVLLQVALAEADRLRRDLDQLVVVDELDRLFERELIGGVSIDVLVLARRRGCW